MYGTSAIAISVDLLEQLPTHLLNTPTSITCVLCGEFTGVPN